MTEILNQIQVLEKKGMVYALVTGCVVFALAFFHIIGHCQYGEREIPA